MEKKHTGNQNVQKHAEDSRSNSACKAIDAASLKENDEGYVKENDAYDRHTETPAMERLKELAISKALGLEGYLQPRRSHPFLRSQWRLKQHQWPRTLCMAWSIEGDHILIGQILIDRIADFHAQT